MNKVDAAKPPEAATNAQSVIKAYTTFAPLYDLFFGRALTSGRRAGIRCMNLQPGQRVLEVGVGTGLSLSVYPAEVAVTGIDISDAMLQKARERVARKGLSHVEGLRNMDAQAMDFADNTFDAVISMYIMSVVPDPVSIVREMSRVCRPGGDIVIVNYFRTRSQKLRWNEWVVKPLSKMFHFRFGLSLEDFTEQARLEVAETSRANIFNHTTVLHCRNNGAPAPEAKTVAEAG